MPLAFSTVSPDEAERIVKTGPNRTVRENLTAVGAEWLAHPVLTQRRGV